MVQTTMAEPLSKSLPMSWLRTKKKLDSVTDGLHSCKTDPCVKKKLRAILSHRTNKSAVCIHTSSPCSHALCLLLACVSLVAGVDVSGISAPADHNMTIINATSIPKNESDLYQHLQFIDSSKMDLSNETKLFITRVFLRYNNATAENIKINDFATLLKRVGLDLKKNDTLEDFEKHVHSERLSRKDQKVSDSIKTHSSNTEVLGTTEQQRNKRSVQYDASSSIFNKVRALKYQLICECEWKESRF